MQYFPPALENLVEQFAKLPGVGVKSAQRLAFYVLSRPTPSPRRSSAPRRLSTAAPSARI